MLGDQNTAGRKSERQERKKNVNLSWSRNFAANDILILTFPPHEFG